MKIQDWMSDILSAPTVQDYVDRFYDRLELDSGIDLRTSKGYMK